MNDIKKLQETTSLYEADKILNKLKASPTTKRLIQESITYRLSPHESHKLRGEEILQVAIKEMEDEDKEIKEEVVDNNNSTSANTGSEQSSENEEPYSGEGKDESNSDIESMQTANGDNAFSETDGMITDDMEPEVAKQVSEKMGNVPPLNTNQQLKQMQYTVKRYHEKYVVPLLQNQKIMRETIKKLSFQIKETEARSGKFTATIQQKPKMRETVSTGQNLFEIRQDIEQMDKMLRD